MCTVQIMLSRFHRSFSLTREFVPPAPGRGPLRGDRTHCQCSFESRLSSSFSCSTRALREQQTHCSSPDLKTKIRPGWVRTEQATQSQWLRHLSLKFKFWIGNLKVDGLGRPLAPKPRRKAHMDKFERKMEPPSLSTQFWSRCHDSSVVRSTTRDARDSGSNPTLNLAWSQARLAAWATVTGRWPPIDVPKTPMVPYANLRQQEAIY